MIMWVQKNPEHKTIKDVVLANTGMTEDELLIPKEHYHIDRLDEAAEIIKATAKTDTPISVVADYDADGICAAAVMWMLLRELGVKPKIRIPRRFSEGYGLSENIIDELEPGLLITVDNGIVAHAAIQKAKEKGFYVIVTDHHLSDGISLPNADVIIDPNAIPGSADFNGYCGAGIAYKLAVEILGKDHPLVPVLLSFAAIATVADVMPLIHENRFIVKDGLESMTGKGRTIGLLALLERCGFESYITAKDIGFKIAPVLNAPGRLEDDGAMKSLRQLVFNGGIDHLDANDGFRLLCEAKCNCAGAAIQIQNGFFTFEICCRQSFLIQYFRLITVDLIERSRRNSESQTAQDIFNCIFAPQNLGSVAQNGIAFSGVEIDADGGHAVELGQLCNQELFLRNILAVDDQADHNLTCCACCTHENMSHKSLMRGFIIGRYPCLLHPRNDSRFGLIGDFGQNQTAIDLDHIVCALLKKADFSVCA